MHLPSQPTTISTLAAAATLALGLVTAAPIPAAQALDPGTHTLALVDANGAEQAIGTVTLKATEEEGALSYALDIDYSLFEDHFLSMKEMKCLGGGPELWCHLPYPYDTPRTIAAGDYTWLEHDLLFMYKLPTEYGANFWNGIYYKIEEQDGTLVGQAMAVDLNMLAAPPEDLSIPPVGEYDVEPVDRFSRWLPEVVIRPVL